MQPFLVFLDKDLRTSASSRLLSGTLDKELSYVYGSQELQTPKGINYDLRLTNTGEAILLEGSVSCEAHTCCARCLEPLSLIIEGNVDAYYVTDFSLRPHGRDNDEFEIIEGDGSFDIAPALQAALVYATPFVTLCSPDCAGLCPYCGINLNEDSCNCAEERAKHTGPFEVLKDFFDKEPER